MLLSQSIECSPTIICFHSCTVGLYFELFEVRNICVSMTSHCFLLMHKVNLITFSKLSGVPVSTIIQKCMHIQRVATAAGFELFLEPDESSQVNHAKLSNSLPTFFTFSHMCKQVTGVIMTIMACTLFI